MCPEVDNQASRIYEQGEGGCISAGPGGARPRPTLPRAADPTGPRGDDTPDKGN